MEFPGSDTRVGCVTEVWELHLELVGVIDTTEHAEINQRIGQQLQATVPLLDIFKS